VLDGLHALSRTEWVINERVLRVVQYLWEAYPSGLPYVADTPSSVELPTVPSRDYIKSLSMNERKRIEQEYVEDLKLAMHIQANYHSQRIAARLKLDVAADFVSERFFFPHNLDFRGRAYAVGPHLQYLGDDLARGLLLFAEGKPLGERGLYWLKVQLANLYGMDKLSLDDRVKWTDSVIANGILRAVDEQPMGRAAMDWWCASDNPVQALALCFDLQAALDSDDPRFYVSSSAVHMDGSCNGLQHYAALGRDAHGAVQVNLVPGEKPADVYSGVRSLVDEKIHETAQVPHLSENALRARYAAGDTGDRALYKELEHRRLAKLLDGKITRKIVKQTVMTSVYGVTIMGARQQILNRLLDVYMEGGFGPDLDRSDLPKMASYIADLTLNSLDESFNGATRSMAWLVEVAGQVSKDCGMPVEWTTPLGWPVLQPYFKIKKRRIRTVLHMMTVMSSGDLEFDVDNTRAPDGQAEVCVAAKLRAFS